MSKLLDGFLKWTYNKNMDKEKLNKISIFSLRNMARDRGMQSPTTRKKKELIEFITTHEVSNRDNSKNKLGRKPSVVLESEKLDNEFVIEIRIKY